MEKDEMLKEICAILKKGDFEIAEPLFRSASFDLVAKRERVLLILKALMNIDALRTEIARELRLIAKQLSAAPIVIGKKSAMGEIIDGVVYSRHGVPIISLNTFRDFILENVPPLVYASPGGLYVNIDGEILRAIRTRCGLSLGQLAEIAGVSRKAIQFYEEGMSATIDIALRLEEYLNAELIKPIDLLRFAEEEEPVKYPEPRRSNSDIYEKLVDIGYDVYLTTKCPFDALSKDSREVMLTGVEKVERKIRYKAASFRVLSRIFEKKAFIVVENYSKEVVAGVPVIKKEELMDMEKSDDVKKLIEERSAL